MPAPTTKYWVQLAMEQFPPSSIIERPVAAEQAGFDALNVRDHLQPWWEPGESGHAWVTLGAAGRATGSIRLGTGVTAPVFRHNPAVVAQAFAILEELYPGRAFIGIGSGESLDESPAGMDWPPAPEQVDRMAEALEIIGRLLDRERLDFEGRFFRAKRAFLHTRPERRPEIYVSAFGPRAARLAARHGDGLWTLAEMHRRAERRISDEEFAASYILSADPDHDIESDRRGRAHGRHRDLPAERLRDGPGGGAGALRPAGASGAPPLTHASASSELAVAA